MLDSSGTYLHFAVNPLLNISLGSAANGFTREPAEGKAVHTAL